MTAPFPAAVAVDTMVFSWLTEDEPTHLGTTYAELVGDSAIVLPFQTVAELRFGALNRSWGDLRLRRLERAIAEYVSVQSDDDTTRRYGTVRVPRRG